MGKVMSMISRKVNRFNVENRAHRVLERDKPVPAPKYESNLKDMQRSLKEDPHLIEKLNTKDSALHNRLKSVYVTSTDISIDSIRESSESESRPLPADRTPPEDFQYGFREPHTVRPGRCTLQQAVQFINDHHSNPEVWTAKKIATEYKLDEKAVVNVLKYCKPFNVHLPVKEKSESPKSLLKQLMNKTDPK